LGPSAVGCPTWATVDLGRRRSRTAGAPGAYHRAPPGRAGRHVRVGERPGRRECGGHGRGV